ncbi:MAG: phosphonate C-P lyase system protein PhnH [Finegoldia sp.]|nr:phosphonate C-P lyase system protein PhnH [Finegoldia sp.]
MEEITRNTGITYRNLLKAIYYPGRVFDMCTFKDYGLSLSNEAIEIALTLLDGEVSFYIDGEDEKSIEEISIRTNSRVDDFTRADFIFIPRDRQTDLEKYKDVKLGSLVDPQESASFIVEVKSLEEGKDYKLTGPGIDGSLVCKIDQADDILALRKDLVDFPQGIDIFFVDENKKLMAIPRSTRVEGVK